MNIFLLLTFVLIITFLAGKLIEKIRVPWVFSALFLGLILSLSNPFPKTTSSESFQLLADLGMYFLLFIIGLDIDLAKIREQGLFISKMSFSLIIAESLFGSIFIHHVFGVGWEMSILTASSFATIGETVLIPILDEFKLTKTRFGQILLGIGTLDDIAELILIIAISFIIGSSETNQTISITSSITLLGLLFLIPVAFHLLKQKLHVLKFNQVPALFLFGLVVLFFSIGLGQFTDSSAVGAILAGVALKNLLSEKQIDQFESLIRVIAYGLLVPVFFLKVGLEVDLRYLLTYPLLIITVLFITNSTKLLLSYFFARKKLGVKKSILLGIGLSAKFSTSIVIVTLLREKGLIPMELYSVLIGSMILSKFIIPTSFSFLLKKWQLEFKPE